jgi:surface carbohydrate biosynthesis protein
MKNKLKKLIRIFKISLFFLPPKKCDLLIFDRTGSYVFKKYLINLNYQILDTRLESLNIFILFRSLLKYKLKFNLLFYFIEYIEYSKSTVVVTFIDNYINYYNLKKYLQSVKFISIQNGMRTKYFFDDLKKYNDLKIDLFLTFNDFYSQEFSKKIEGNYSVIGSFLSNQISIKKDKLNFVNYISSGPETLETIKIYQDKSINTQKYYLPEKFCINLIKNYCIKNDLKLNILGRATSLYSKKIEKKFYSDILGDYHFNYVEFENENKDKRYQICDNAQINFCIYSALGLEILSRCAKTYIFNYRDNATGFSSLNIFWPLEISPEGDFWTSSKNEKKIHNCIDSIIKTSDEEWKKNINKKFNNLIKFDYDNQIFIRKIKDLLNE